MIFLVKVNPCSCLFIFFLVGLNMYCRCRSNCQGWVGISFYLVLSSPIFVPVPNQDLDFQRNLSCFILHLSRLLNSLFHFTQTYSLQNGIKIDRLNCRGLILPTSLKIPHNYQQKGEIGLKTLI